MYKLIKILANFIFTSFQYSMNIQSIPQQQPTFTARNNELKNADKIMRPAYMNVQDRREYINLSDR